MCLFALIRSEFIDPENCPRVCYQIVCGPYTNCTHGFASPSGLWKVVVSVPFGCSESFASIDYFALSKIYFRLFDQDFFSNVLLVCIEFNISVLIYPENFPRVC